MYKQLMEQFGDVQQFIDDMVRENVAPQISRQLVDFFSHLNNVVSRKLELAALVDVGKVFVKDTYILEGEENDQCNQAPSHEGLCLPRKRNPFLTDSKSSLIKIQCR